MSAIQRLIRTALPVLGLAAACLAAPASAAGHEEKSDSSNKRARADFASCAKPAWPAGAIQAQHTGTVTLGFLISKNGEVLESKVNESSGHPALDEAARDGIKLCQFHAATKNGKPTEEWMQMQYVWALK